MKVYLLTMYAVFDQGAGGVFTTRELAEARARELHAESDGHHDWRVDELVLDEPAEPHGSLAFTGWRPSVPPTVKFVPHQPAV